MKYVLTVIDLLSVNTNGYHMPTVSVIMPAYNEGGHIYDNIAETRRILAETGIDAEIVAVDDGSSDNTLTEIERAERELERVVCARNPYNMGKGMALRTGFDYSSGDVIVFLDADLDLHPSQVTTVIAELEKGPYDIVVTSKHHPESTLDYPWFRKVASYCYYMMIKVVFGLPVRDTQTGLKVFRREVLSNVFHRLLVKKFAYDVELLATSVRFGYRVHEIPVALDFKRALKWGRIRITDVISIFVDTLAIFYRLRILRYYDAGRPASPREHPRVLVLVRGCPPPDDVVKRLSVDSNTSIACIAGDERDSREDIRYFATMDQFREWYTSVGETYQYVGFLGPGYLPNGSWVKNAVRNFQDEGVMAVCGPLIPGPFTTRMGNAAGLVSSSFMSVGSDMYLYSFRRVRSPRKGSMDNVFLRGDYFKEKMAGNGDLSLENGWVYDNTSKSGLLRYDPDVAVSKAVPPLFVSYLSCAARKTFMNGCRVFGNGRVSGGLWLGMMTLLWLFISTGWLLVPVNVYASVVITYLLIVMATGLMCFDLLTFPLLSLGIMLAQAVRSGAFIVGLAGGIIGCGHKNK